MPITTIYHPGDEVTLKDGRTGLLYAFTQNSRNPLARDSRKLANWFFIPDSVGVQGGVVVSNQPCTVSELDVDRVTGHRSGNWPEAGHVLGFEERQWVYVAAMRDELQKH